MSELGFVRVCASAPEVKPGDVEFNLSKIEVAVIEAINKNADFIVFPELSLTGYTCADLFYQPLLINSALSALTQLSERFKNDSIVIFVGLPVEFGNKLYNCAAALYKGEILGIVPKTHLPNYNEYYEKRWFSSSTILPQKENEIHIVGEKIPFGSNLVFDIDGIKFSAEICEDLWVPNPPSGNLSMGGAEIIFNLSASNEQTGKNGYLLDLIKSQSARCRCGYVYASAGLGESSTDLAFAGNCVIAENGSILACSDRFKINSKSVIADLDLQIIRNDRIKFSSFSDNSSNIAIRYILINDPTFNDELKFNNELIRRISPTPFTEGSKNSFKERCEEISSIQAWGLSQRLRAINCRSAIIGISGGLDSTLALLVTVKAFDNLNLNRKDIHAVTMPGLGTTARTRSNALELMELLGVIIHEIPINKAVKQHFEDIGHDPEILNATYENSQARERTQILMDLANKYNGIVIGTGDLSELALGWCTYNGDQMSMYGVNASVPKTLVKHLVKGYADNTENVEIRKVLTDIIDTPISPELLPAGNDGKIAQKTEDTVGPYVLHDFFIHAMLRHSMPPAKIYFLAKLAFKGVYSNSEIKKWLKNFYIRFFSQQFKRSCMPDGIKVGSICLSPRGDWRMPSDASSKMWLQAIEELTD